MEVDKVKSRKIGGFERNINSKTERPVSQVHKNQRVKKEKKEQRYLNEDIEGVDSDSDISKPISNTATAPTAEQSQNLKYTSISHA